jgi:hypothetical protein
VKTQVAPAVRGYDATLHVETEANDGPRLTNEQIETLRQGAYTAHASDAYNVSMSVATFERIVATLTYEGAKRYAASTVDVEIGALTIRVLPERRVDGMPLTLEQLEIAIDGKIVPLRAFTLRGSVRDVVELDVEGMPFGTESVQHDVEFLALGKAPVGALEGPES